MTPERLEEIRRRFTAMSSYELNCDTPTHDMVDAIEELLAHVDALEKKAVGRARHAFGANLPDIAGLDGPATPLTPCVGRPMQKYHPFGKEKGPEPE